MSRYPEGRYWLLQNPTEPENIEFPIAVMTVGPIWFLYYEEEQDLYTIFAFDDHLLKKSNQELLNPDLVVNNFSYHTAVVLLQTLTKEYPPQTPPEEVPIFNFDPERIIPAELLEVTIQQYLSEIEERKRIR